MSKPLIRLVQHFCTKTTCLSADYTMLEKTNEDAPGLVLLIGMCD